MKKTLWYVVLGIVCIIVVIDLYFSFKNSPSMTSTSTSMAGMDMSSSTTPAPKTSSTATSVPKNSVVIHISNFAFSPKNLTVKKGTTVTWVNNDSVGHTVTAYQSGPTSNTLGPGMTYSYNFSTVGIYGYHCSIHPTMTGVITVQ